MASARHYRHPSRSDRELALVCAAKDGDQVAAEELIESFRPSIRAIARRYRSFSWVSDEELDQEGALGLLRAVRRYEPRRETPFWAYASWWVRQAMQQLVSELTGPVVLSDRAARHLARLKKARSRYQQTHLSEPSPSQLADEAHLGREQVEQLVAAEQTAHSLDEPAGDDTRTSRLEDGVIDPRGEDEYDRVVDRNGLSGLSVAVSKRLDDRERQIVRARYGFEAEGRTLRQLAERFGLSVERIRQIEEGALSKLRAATGC